MSPLQATQPAEDEVCSDSSSNVDEITTACLTAWNESSPPATVEEGLAQYYLRKLKIDVSSGRGKLELGDLLQNYLEGLQWNLWYYYRGQL